jgi:hypothetical protein
LGEKATVGGLVRPCFSEEEIIEYDNIGSAIIYDDLFVGDTVVLDPFSLFGEFTFGESDAFLRGVQIDRIRPKHYYLATKYYEQFTSPR